LEKCYFLAEFITGDMFYFDNTHNQTIGVEHGGREHHINIFISLLAELPLVDYLGYLL